MANNTNNKDIIYMIDDDDSDIDIFYAVENSSSPSHSAAWPRWHSPQPNSPQSVTTTRYSFTPQSEPSHSPQPSTSYSATAHQPNSSRGVATRSLCSLQSRPSHSPQPSPLNLTTTRRWYTTQPDSSSGEAERGSYPSQAGPSSSGEAERRSYSPQAGPSRLAYRSRSRSRSPLNLDSSIGVASHSSHSRQPEPTGSVDCSYLPYRGLTPTPPSIVSYCLSSCWVEINELKSKIEAQKRMYRAVIHEYTLHTYNEYTYNATRARWSQGYSWW